MYLCTCFRGIVSSALSSSLGTSHVVYFFIHDLGFGFILLQNVTHLPGGSFSRSACALLRSGSTFSGYSPLSSLPTLAMVP